MDAVIARPSGRWTSGADRKGRGCRLLRVGRGAGAVRSPSPAGRVVQPPLNGATSGLVLEYRPAGLGYQIHTCMVVRSGCQKLNLDYWATGTQPALRGDRTRRRLNDCLPPHQALHTVSEEHYLREAGQHLPRPPDLR